MKNIGLTFMAVMIASIVFGQTSVDALRFSQRYYSGTARSMAMGGSLGAVGADLSTMSTNPAGIGLYRKSVFEFTPIINNTVVSSNYLGNNYSEDKLNASLGNVGVVWAMPILGSDMKYFQFGMGFNRLNDYNSEVYIKGDNSKTSFVNDLQNQAYDVYPDELNGSSTNLAWYSYLFSDTTRLSNGKLWYHSFFENGGVEQERTIRTRGGMNEFNMTMGTSFLDKLYLGASLGYTYLRYEEVSRMTEYDRADTIQQLNAAYYDYDINASGGGLSFKIGFVYRPTSWLRIGGAYHAPTNLRLVEDYTASIEAIYDDNSSYVGDRSEFSSNGFEYNVKTPMRLVADAAFVVGQKLIISGEYEYVDYSEATMKYSEGISSGAVNDEINRKYTSTHNIRGGAEFNINPILIRAGVAYYSSPFDDNINDGSMMKYSAGIGVRQSNYFAEFAYVYSQKSEDYYIYNSQLVDPAVLGYTTHQVVATLGFKF